VAGADRVVNNAPKGASQVNKTEITFKNHGVTFEGITLLDAEEVQVAIQTIHSNFEAEIAELEKEGKILYIEAQINGIELVADWVDGYYAPCVVGVVARLAEELKKLREGGFTRTKKPNKGM
jgi:hypothetical protein